MPFHKLKKLIFINTQLKTLKDGKPTSAKGGMGVDIRFLNTISSKKLKNEKSSRHFLEFFTYKYVVTAIYEQNEKIQHSINHF